LRLANAEVLPFRFAPLVENLTKYVEEIEALAKTKREHAEKIGRQLDAGLYSLVLDSRKSLAPPAAETPVPHFNFAPLHNALTALAATATSVDAQLEMVSPGADVSELNKRLYQSERQLTASGGLPGRQWYRHQIYAPGLYTGYGVKTLPRVREAIEAELYTSVDEAIVVTAGLLREFTQYLAAIEALAKR